MPSGGENYTHGNALRLLKLRIGGLDQKEKSIFYLYQRRPQLTTSKHLAYNQNPQVNYGL